MGSLRADAESDAHGREGRCVRAVFRDFQKLSERRQIPPSNTQGNRECQQKVRSQVELGMKQGEELKSRVNGEECLKLPQKGPVSPRFNSVAAGEGRWSTWAHWLQLQTRLRSSCNVLFPER